MRLSPEYGESCAVSVAEIEDYRCCSGCVRQWIPRESGLILGFLCQLDPGCGLLLTGDPAACFVLNVNSCFEVAWTGHVVRRDLACWEQVLPSRGCWLFAALHHRGLRNKGSWFDRFFQVKFR